MYLMSLDTSVNVALPSIAEDFDIHITSVQWIIIAYLVTRASLLLAAGGAADAFGLKRVFIAGMAVYIVAVIIIGVLPDLYLIFGMRVFQAVGAGMVYATVPAIVGRTFPPGQRGLGMGVVTAGLSLGMVTGALGAGVLVESLGWRSIFWGRVPIGIAVLMLGLVVVPRYRPVLRGERNFDWLGAVFLTAGLVAVLLALTSARVYGWVSLPVVIFVTGAAVAFWLVSRAGAWSRQPMLDMSLMKLRPYVAEMAAMFLGFLGAFTIWFIFPFYVADLLGEGPRVLGVLIATLAASSSVASPLSGRFSDLARPQYVATVGLVLVVLGLFWVSSLDDGSPLVLVGLRMVVVGVGLGTFLAAAPTLVLNIVPREQLARASAGLSLSQTMASVCSVALASTIFTASQDAHGGEFIPAFQATFRWATLSAGMAVLVSLVAWKGMNRLS